MIARYIHHGRETTQLGDENLQALKDNDVLIKVKKSLISVGTELAYLKYDRHEGHSGYAVAGEVIEMGKSVTRYKLGQRVFSYNGHASHIRIPETHNAFPIPDGVTDTQGTFCALTCIAMYIASRAEISIGRTVVVVGQGTVGQLVSQMARLAGAGMIIGVDRDPKRLKLSRQLGVDETIAPDKAELDAALSRRIPESCPPVFIEVTGVTEALGWTLASAPLHSRIVVTGTYMQNLTLNAFQPFIERELDVVGAHNPKAPDAPSHRHPYTRIFNNNFALDSIRRGRVRVDELIDAVLKPSEAVQFYNDAVAGRPRPTQPLIDWE